MPFANLNRIRIHHESLGEGDPVFLINGLSAPSTNWLLPVKGLSPHFRVITIERWEDFNRAVLSFLRGVKR